MPCKSGNCQRITSIFSVSSPIFRSILKSAWTSSTKNKVLASAACSVTLENYSSRFCSNASSMGEFCPFSNLTQIPLAMNSGKNWRKPGSRLAKRRWSAWCKSTFTTTANLSLTSPRCGANTSARRTTMFSCSSNMPCNLPVWWRLGIVSNWCVNCASTVWFLLECLWSAACRQKSGTWNIQLLGISVRSFHHAACNVLPTHSKHMSVRSVVMQLLSCKCCKSKPAQAVAYQYKLLT